MLCPWGRTSRIFIYGEMRDRSMRSGTKLAREIQLTDWSTAGNLSNLSSGVQMPRGICTRFGRYLYSTKCSWIIKTLTSLFLCFKKLYYTSPSVIHILTRSNRASIFPPLKRGVGTDSPANPRICTSSFNADSPSLEHAPIRLTRLGWWTTESIISNSFFKSLRSLSVAQSERMWIERTQSSVIRAIKTW